MAPLTAETRLYRWLKRKTTPADAWRTMSVKQLAEKARCSTSQVSRTLPRVVAKLNDISLDEAETAVADVMAVRRCRLLDWEIELLKRLRSQEPPVSYFRLALLLGVAEKQIADISNALGLGFSTQGCGSMYQGKQIIPEEFQHRIPELQAHVESRSKLRQKHKNAARLARLKSFAKAGGRETAFLIQLYQKYNG